jgi:hypothetical protein
VRESPLPSIRAWCRHYGAPDPGEADEQMRFRARAEFLEWLDARTVEGWRPATKTETWFNRDPLPVSCWHQWPGAAARKSLRECATGWSCQVVLFLTLTGECIAYQIDFDEENPLGGALKAVQHFFRTVKRWRFGGETAAAALRRGLERKGIRFQEED